MSSARFVVLVASVALMLIPQIAAAQTTPSAAQIERQLQAAPRVPVPPQSRITIPELKQRPDLRVIAPSIEIQTINFEFGSAAIPFSEYGKVENIAIAVLNLLQRNPLEIFLIEGHTDAVGTREFNQILSEQRADSLKQVLVVQFGVPSRAMATVGYGKDYLLIPVPYAEWRNRRVTIRRITDIVRPF